MRPLSLVVLDIADPFIAPNRLCGVESSSDVVVLPAGSDATYWVSRTTHVTCESAFHDDMYDLQSSLGALLADIISLSPLTFAGVDLSACLEYVGWLSLVQLARDALVLRRASEAICVAKRPLREARWITGRRDTEGLLGLLSAERRFAWKLETRPEPHYLEAKLDDARPRVLPWTKASLRDSGQRRPRGEYALATQSEFTALQASAHAGSMPALLLPISPAAALAHLNPRRALEVAWSANLVALQCVRSVVPLAARWFANAFPEFPLCNGMVSAIEKYLAAGVASSVWPSIASAALVLGDYTRPPEVVLVGNDVTPGYRAAILAASAQGTRSMMVQHGLFGMRFLHDRPLADRIGVWGCAGQAWIESCGVDPARIDIVGHPTMREPAPSPSIGRPSVGRRPLRVLYLSSLSYAGFHLNEDQCVSRMYLAVAYEACRSVGAQLVARPHPSESSRAWGLSVHDGSVSFSVDRGASLTHSIAQANVVVTTASTTVLDALSLCKPVVLLRVEPEPLPGYDEVAVFRRAASASELAAILQSIDSQAGPAAGDCAAALHYLAGPLDGRMGERLTTVMGMGV